MKPVVQETGASPHRQMTSVRQGSLVFVGVAICVPIVIAASWFCRKLYWPGGQCPWGTFGAGLLGSETAPMLGEVITVLSVMTLVCFAALRSAAMLTSNRVRAIVLTVGPLVGIALGCTLSVIGGARYFCLTPNEVMLRDRIWAAPRVLAWDTLAVVRGGCYRGVKSGGPGGYLELEFPDVPRLRFGLMDGFAIDWGQWARIQSVLVGRNWRYRPWYTVTEENCPAALVPLLTVGPRR